MVGQLAVGSYVIIIAYPRLLSIPTQIRYFKAKNTKAPLGAFE